MRCDYGYTSLITEAYTLLGCSELKREVVLTSKAPKPLGPYSQAIKVGNWVFISGQLPIDPVTSKLIKGNIKEATRTVLNNIKAILEAAGASLNDVVKVTVFMKDVSKFSEFNEVYSEFFKEEPPARSVVEVSRIPKDADLEVEVIAYIGCSE